MTKNDLKNGMVVETKCGERFICIDGYLVGEGAFSEFDNYDDNMENNFNKDYDIVKVFNPYWGSIINVFNKDRDEFYKIFWERDSEAKEVTMTEIEEKFGCKIKIVKEKS